MIGYGVLAISWPGCSFVVGMACSFRRKTMPWWVTLFVVPVVWWSRIHEVHSIAMMGVQEDDGNYSMFTLAQEDIQSLCKWPPSPPADISASFEVVDAVSDGFAIANAFVLASHIQPRLLEAWSTNSFVGAIPMLIVMRVPCMMVAVQTGSIVAQACSLAVGFENNRNVDFVAAVAGYGGFGRVQQRLLAFETKQALDGEMITDVRRTIFEIIPQFNPHC